MLANKDLKTGRFTKGGVNTKATLMSRVDKLKTGCWKWLGSIGSHGYAQVSWQNKVTMVHKVLKGGAPKGKLYLHTCDNRWCVNPDHIYFGTHSDNIHDIYKDGVGKKLIASQVVAIRDSNLMHKELAIKFKVSEDTIYKIKNRYTWKRLE